MYELDNETLVIRKNVGICEFNLIKAPAFVKLYTLIVYLIQLVSNLVLIKVQNKRIV